ncbi:hypothetical protein [Streptomyces sp. NPDC003832]
MHRIRRSDARRAVRLRRPRARHFTYKISAGIPALGLLSGPLADIGKPSHAALIVLWTLCCIAADSIKPAPAPDPTGCDCGSATNHRQEPAGERSTMENE